MTLGTIGLDLSLRASAACWIPNGWTGNIAHVRTGAKSADWGYPLDNDAAPEERTRRMIRISSTIIAFCKKNRPSSIVVEHHAFSQQSSRAAELHELHGVVKADVLREIGLPVVPVTASSARATLLSNVPRKNSKSFTISNVRRLGGQAIYWTEDEADAFCCANGGLKLEGQFHLQYEGK